jgi:hypothetical protein
MTLQGDLAMFSLPDVLRLLSTTGKSGHLSVTTDRTTGTVVFSEGRVTSIQQGDGWLDRPAAVSLFELLRHQSGSFVFNPVDAIGELPIESVGEVDDLLREAEHVLAEWHVIEAIVPSLDWWASLSPDLPRSEVVIDAARWQVIVAIGIGAQVGALAEDLQLGELDASRAVKDLVELGLVSVTPDPSPTVAALLGLSSSAMVVVEDGSVTSGWTEPVPESVGAFSFGGPVADSALVVDSTWAVASQVGLTALDDRPSVPLATDEPHSGELSAYEPTSVSTTSVSTTSVSTTSVSTTSVSTTEFSAESDADAVAAWGAPPVFGSGSPTAPEWTEDRSVYADANHRTLPADVVVTDVIVDVVAEDGTPRASVDTLIRSDLGITIPGQPSLVGAAGDEEEDPTDIDLGDLSPRAARAIALAAQASNEAERDAAIADAIATNETPLDRSRVLRFLRSIRG